MSKPLSLFAIGLLFGGGLGFAGAAGSGVTFDGHDHAHPSGNGAASASQTGGAHHAAHHMPFDVPAENAPEVSIDLIPDPVEGFNLRVQPRNFTFSPEGASLGNVPGEGHAHVYINGAKLGRLYGEWMHIAALPKGAVEVAVTLNTNDHRPLAVAGQPITARTQLVID